MVANQSSHFKLVSVGLDEIIELIAARGIHKAITKITPLYDFPIAELIPKISPMIIIPILK